MNQQTSQYERPSEGLLWGACVDCGAPLWVSPTSTDAHCTPCHMKRLGFAPLAG